MALDDADGRILYAQFVAQEGTLSTFQALTSIVREHGRFCELYTDRGSHFCRTEQAGHAPAEEHKGQELSGISFRLMSGAVACSNC